MPKANRAISTPKHAAPTQLPPVVRYDINTVAGLVEAFGGEDAVAHKFDVIPQNVRNWEISGHIPNGWHLDLLVKVFALGKTITPAIFGFDDDDEAAQGLADLMRAAHRPVEGGDNV